MREKTKKLQVSDVDVILDFPLRGEWLAPTTPAKRIPSHGLAAFGETYAYDFVKPGPTSDTFYDVSPLKYLLHGVSLRSCYGWGADIFAPCDAQIISVEDGVQEREPVSLRGDLKYMAEVTKRFKDGTASYRDIAGNHVIMKCKGGFFALFAHLRTKSITVHAGQQVVSGEPIGQVGHSGNSTAPHLHFQIMESAEIETAIGLPCAFRDYEERRKGEWQYVPQGIPTSHNRIRKLP